MFTMTPASNTRPLALWVGLACILASPVWAQDIVWPNTFNGQPEFSFSKKDITAEQKKLAVGRGRITDNDPVAALSVLVKRGVADPFATRQPEIAPILNLQGPRLNDLLSDEDAPLAEFKKFVTALVENASHLDLSSYDFNTDMQRIVIEALVSSPHAYVIINGQRYTEGDAFNLALAHQDETPHLRSTIDRQIPSPATLSEKTFLAYTNLRDEALATYQQILTASNASGVGHKVRVMIKRIQHRTLILSIQDKDYTLKLGAVL